jgi:tetratricopeptide (TPR) repeat protein
VYAALGQWEKARNAFTESLQLAPDHAGASSDLSNSLLALQRFDEARQIIQQAQARKLDNLVLHNALYALAFLWGDSSGLSEQQQWFAGKPEENFGLALASDTEAYRGRLSEASELTRRAVESATRADSKESGAIWLANASLRQAAYGNAVEARQTAAKALKLAPGSQGTEAEAALAFAMAGDAARAESLAQDLGRRFPLDTQVHSLWLTAIQAQLALDRKDMDYIMKAPQSVSPIEYGTVLFVANSSCLYPTYIRGQAYLTARQGTQAAREFQKILDHGGIVWNCWTGALAHLGMARANALESKTSRDDHAVARLRALAAYKDFLALWKDADPDIPIYKQAKREYAMLQ